MVAISAIEHLLQSRFKGAEIAVIDDSAQHAGHAQAPSEGSSHFTVRIISDEFEGKNRVARHRAVYAVLQPLFDQGLHALVIDTKTSKEI